MITSWDIYLITRLDNIVACAISFSIAGGFAAIVAAICIPMHADCIGISDKAWKIIKKVVKIFIPMYIVRVYNRYLMPKFKRIRCHHVHT